jgi:hypothetical protein
MKKKLFVLLVMSVGLAYAIKTVKELSNALDSDLFDIDIE